MRFSDEELMAMYVSGMSEAFDMIYDRYRHNIYRFALSCTFNAEDAEDVVQEVFVRLSRAVYHYRPEGRFRSWLFQIAANRIRTLMSGRIRYLEHKKQFADYRIDMESRTAENGVIAMDMMEKALSMLPEDQRMAIVLKEIEGMNCAAVAETMSVSPANVRVLIHRARKTIISFLCQEQGDPTL